MISYSRVIYSWYQLVTLLRNYNNFYCIGKASIISGYGNGASHSPPVITKPFCYTIATLGSLDDQTTFWFVAFDGSTTAVNANAAPVGPLTLP